MAKTMQQLLQKQDQPKLPKIGDIVQGKVIEIGNNAVYLDLSPFGAGVVLGKELYDGLKTMDKIKIGDEVTAMVLEAENEDGYTELSFREAGQEKAWQSLETKMEQEKIVKTKILDANKGGLIIEISGVIGFLPVSQLNIEHYPRVSEGDKTQILSHLRQFIGKNFKVKIINLDQEREKLIVSEKAVEADQHQDALAKLKIGQKVKGKITGISHFGAFVKFKIPKSKQEIEGLVHISEMAWQRIDNPEDIITVGDEIEAKIINLSNNRVSLSIKDLQEDPWQDIEKKYKLGQEVKGKILKVDHFGAFVQIDKNIHGLAHVSQFSQGINLKINKPYKFKITSLEPKEHRMGLEKI